MFLNRINKDKFKAKELDIRGKLCPMTFVYTKLTLEEMSKDEVLEVILDFPPAVKNIPDNCHRQGIAELLEKVEINPEKKTWKLILKKL